MAIDLINYAFIRGKWYSFSDAPTAQQAVQKYNGNPAVQTSRPVGVLIDESLLNLNINQWPNTVADAVGVTGDALINPPVNVITGPATEEVAQTPAGTTFAGPPSPPGPSGDDEVVEEVDPWAALDQGKLNLAKRYADAGMLGRAATAFKDAGGTWDRTTGDRLRTEAGETPRYGGDFDWSKFGIRQRDFGTISDWAKEGKFGKIKKKVGGDNWTKELHRKLAAEYQGKGGTEGAPVREQLSSTPQIYETGTKKWGQQFKGPIETGAFKTGQARTAAKQWRERHMAKSPKDKKKIQRRFTKMIGHGEFAD